MEDILIIGVSGHTESVLDSLFSAGLYRVFGLCEPLDAEMRDFHGDRVEPGEEALVRARERGIAKAFVGCGCIGGYGRRELYSRLLARYGFEGVNIIDPSAAVSPKAVLGQGIFIGKQAVVNAYARIGDMVIVNTGSFVDHSACVEDFASLAPRTTLLGATQVGRGAYLGAGSLVKQGVKLGREVFVGMGSLVLKDVPPGRLVYGQPCQDRGPNPKLGEGV